MAIAIIWNQKAHFVANKDFIMLQRMILEKNQIHVQLTICKMNDEHKYNKLEQICFYIHFLQIPTWMPLWQL